MQKKSYGFTLTELITTITILGLIALIVIPNVINSIKTSKETIYKSQIDMIKNAAIMWATDNPKFLPVNDGEEIKITLYQLKIGSYIDLELKNPAIEEKNYFPDDLEIIIRKNGAYEYEVIDNEIDYQSSINTDYKKLILRGKSLIYLNIGDEYEDEGAYIDSNEDNYNLTIPNKNPIDTDKAGTYYLKYRYDSIEADGNGKYDSGTVIRTVIVKGNNEDIN